VARRERETEVTVTETQTERQTDRERMGDRNGIWTVKMSQPQSTKILLIGRLVRLGPTRSYLQKKSNNPIEQKLDVVDLIQK